VTFFLNEREDEGTIKWAGEWPFAARAHFIKSNAYETLVRELSRYVNGEVPGRSFLIAGHRGAGKTTLVRYVVEDLNRSIIDTAVEAAKAKSGDAGRMLDQQRPLLVKLHGPSLLGPVRPRHTESSPKKPVASPSGEDPKAKHKASSNSTAASVEHSTPEKTTTSAASADLTVTALEQITVALYRALAAEFGRSFANHARDEIYQAEKAGRPRAQVADYLEIAGQFTLELDNIPRPGTLRAFYRRLGRVDAGVLWPLEVGAALLRAGLNDRGIREIVALSTAAQAFEVCSGTVKSTQTNKDSRSRESSVEAKGAAALKDVVNKISGLAVGAGVGALSIGSLGAPAAIALSLTTWLLSTLGLTWTSKRSAKSERVVDYTFIRERDKQSLERDLPLVIQRVREAGLAPVFMLDELDKLDDAATSIATLIKSLKHLTTDFGCFCFLTDRNYYNYLMAKVEREAFPVEHTYFSHFLFILPHPDRFLDFLRAITRSAPVGAPSQISVAATEVAEETARAIFGLFVLHRSKLNMAEVLRELAEQCDANGRLRPSPTDLKLLEYTFAASIQLAIGLILKRDGIRQRIEAEPRFMQWTIDALYLLSRAWEKKEARVRLNRDAIVTCLLARSGAPAAQDSKEAEEQLLKTGMGRLDLDIIDRSVQALAGLLCSSVKLKSELSKDGRSDLAEIIPQQDLIKRVGKTREFEFLYDMYGEEVLVREKLRSALAAANLPTAIKNLIDDPLEFLREFMAALAVEGLHVHDLVSLQILPATIDAAELDRARKRLADASSYDRPYEGLAKDLPLVGSVVAFVRLNGSKLAALFRLAFQVAADARPAQGEDPLTLRATLEAVARYVDLRTFFQQSENTNALLDAIKDRPSDPPGPVVADNAESVRAWHTSLVELRQRLLAAPPVIDAYSAENLWRLWQERVIKHLTGVSSLVEPPSYADIVCFAADQAPGKMFQRDLGQMSLVQWSDICVSGFPDVSSARAPAWVFVAGLCALGFGRAVLSQAAVFLDKEQQGALEALISRAPERKEGYLLVIQRDGPTIASEPPNLERSPVVPLLALPEENLGEYDMLFGWLTERKALAGTIFEEVRTDEQQEDDIP
jgi:hypothetical protein